MKKRTFLKSLLGLLAVPFIRPESRIGRNLRARGEGAILHLREPGEKPYHWEPPVSYNSGKWEWGQECLSEPEKQERHQSHIPTTPPDYPFFVSSQNPPSPERITHWLKKDSNANEIEWYVWNGVYWQFEHFTYHA